MRDRIEKGLMGFAFVCVGILNTYAGAVFIYEAIRKEA